MQWARHIEDIASKSNKTLGLIKRICSHIANLDTKKLFYCALVRSRLEYCSSLWSPYTVKHRALIENVQRRATKFILNYPSREMSYVDRLRELNDILLLFKFKSGRMHIDCTKYFVPVTCHYVTRNFDTNNFKVTSHFKQNYFKLSYFPRAVQLWNSLPQDCKSCTTISSFKSKLHDFYRVQLTSYQSP